MVIQIIGRKIEETPNEVFIQKDNGLYAYPKKIDPFQTSAKINPSDYALIQEGDTATDALSMIQKFNNLQFIPANKSAFKNLLTIPNTAKFMKQYININEALQGKTVLYDATGNLIEGKRLKSYGYTINKNCWVWLNDSFEKGTGFLNLNLLTIIGFDNGNPKFKSSPLEYCLDKNCWAEVESINKQGLPTRKSRIEKYEPGKIIYFSYPLKDHVAGLSASPNGAGLGCYRNPEGSSASLGVFLCAEGAPKK